LGPVLLEDNISRLSISVVAVGLPSLDTPLSELSPSDSPIARAR
jgi:hypothetical protein